MIYHIATESEWEASLDDENYIPERYAEDEFIHCSTKDQIVRTAHRLYSDESYIILLYIDDSNESDFIKYENLEGGTELFPHIYRPLPKESISRVVKVGKKDDGSFDFPDDITQS